MLKNVGCYATDGLLSHGSENCIAEFLEECGRNAGCAVCGWIVSQVEKIGV